MCLLADTESLEKKNGLMCVREGRPNVMLKENSERKIAAPGGTRTHNLLLSWQFKYPSREPILLSELRIPIGTERDLEAIKCT